MQSCGERLLEAHEQIPRPELAAMRMTRELQIKTRGRRSRRRARLMSEQYLRRRVRRSPPERGNRIAALLGIEMMRAEVRHAGYHEWRALVSHDDMLVQQHVQS